MSRLLLPLLMAWLFVCLCPGPSIAGDGGEEEVLFYGEDAVKTPSFRVQPLEESPSPVTIITAQDIRNSGALTLPEVLALAPGVDTLRRSESNVEVSIRGFNSYSSNKVLVMLDSRPLFNLADASVNWNLIPVPIDEIERVEIVRGPGSALYGENAFFGIINIITKAPRAGSAKGSARISGGAGTGESTSAKAGASFPLVRVSVEHLELGRYSDKDAQIPNPFVDKLGMTPAAARVRIDRSFIRWDPKTTNGFTNVTGGIALVETDFKNNKRTIDRSYFAAYERAFREGGVDYNLGVRLIAQEQEVDGNNFPKGRPYRHFLRADSELRGVVHPSSSDVFVFGLALSHRMVDDDVFLKSSDNEIRQMVVSPFVENQLALADKKVFLITGIRGDMYQGLEGVASPRAGLIFLISSEQAIKLGWGQAFRSPTLYDLHSEDATMFPLIFQGNPRLKPEIISSKSGMSIMSIRNFLEPLLSAVQKIIFNKSRIV